MTGHFKITILRFLSLCLRNFCWNDLFLSLSYENEIKFRRFEEESVVKVVQVNLECKRLIDGRHWNESESEREGERGREN